MGRKSTGSNGQHLIAFAAMLGLLVGGIAKAEGASYTFTKIADTTGDFSVFFGPPALNDKGVVAFSARLDAGPSGIFTGAGDGTSPRTIADTTGPFSFLSPLPSLSDSGVVAFRAFLDAGGSAIVRTDGSTPTIIATTNPIAQPGRAFRFLGIPSVNDDRTVAFHGLDATGSGIFTSDTSTPIVHRPGISPSFDDNLSVADGGAVAFVAFDATGRGIFRSDGTMIAHTSGPLFKVLGVPSLNSEGAVAFWAMLDAGGDGIFVSNGTTPTTIADSTGPFNSFDNSASINDKGVVAFWASLDDGRHGIFTGPDPGAHKVIAKDDALDGSTVTFLTFGREGLNNAGAVAFVATLADGTRAVYRADPVPSNVPPECSAAQATPGTLWPPDHTFGTVAITGVTDQDGHPVAITVTSIRQDEPVNGRGDGNTAPDGVGVGPLVMVRAERTGRGDGRVYHVSFTADDGQGGQCTGEVVVCVPHDQRPGAVCGDQGALFDSRVDPGGPGS